ncbi:acyl-CoA dehydratase activase-related protein [Sinanaerobacter chloroacetimidivorans]|uniref:2-hydroxyglutaryl-CoA dehydratase n=1 Tax=Sinanaerobacter chloroacetimidivorans TaxID=2818044 RepID=A0A8J8B453_9FIRM|nr:acyl-CoA dehydratase activase-related protein [Sinanaerobacter chloroacetimidivorans]MBR0600431.1 2-hydroxyglutaryl-CoA dehydratase [Sinanaerobacter chloroacetimidivorans]
MKVGIPGGLLYYKYEPFIRTFFNELDLNTEYSTTANKEILDTGAHNCVDEACLPMKIFHGHVSKLQKSCDRVVVPRIMTCEFGESICPKFRGLPELVESGTGKSNHIYSDPIYLDKQSNLKKILKKSSREIGIPDRRFDKAFKLALENQRNTSRGLHENGYKYRVFLAGHPYNIYDRFANMNLIDKLHKLDIGVITEEWVTQYEKQEELRGLIKQPYWLFFIHNYAPALALMKKGEIDGIIYVSSFNCGTDSFSIEMIKNKVGNFPMLVLKLDEQTGEAGYNTRLEAFSEVLK